MSQRTASQIPYLSYLAMAICIAIFLALNASPHNPYRYGHVMDFDIFRGAYWGLITNAFVHLEPIHLLFNMYWLAILGGAFERQFGSAMWAAFVLSAAFVSSGIQLATGEGGIGFSGVGYALFGFGWLARNRAPEFRVAVNDQVIYLFIGWGVFCLVAPAIGLDMHVANMAHLGGFAFGAGIALMVVSAKDRLAVGAVLTLLFAIAGGSLFYNPRSTDWVSLQATRAMRNRDYQESLRWFKQAQAMGVDPVWVWDGIAQIYGYQQKAGEYASAVEQLRKLDPRAAKEVEDRYGKVGAEPSDSQDPSEASP